MSINELIISTLKPLGLDISPTVYKGNNKQFITFNIVDDRGDVYVDNKPRYDLIHVQVHLFTPVDVNNLRFKREIRDRLFNAGFTYPTVTNINESDVGMNHLVFECSINMKIEREEF